VDSKAEYSALSSTRSQKKKLLQQTTPVALNTVQVKIRESSPGGIRVTMEERICMSFKSGVTERSREWQMVRMKVMTVMRWYA